MTQRRRGGRALEAEELAEWLDDGPGFTPEFMALRERESRRAIHTAMKFWFACPKRACRRHRRCVHDPAYCGPLFWPVVPPEIRAWWRALHDARAEGRTLRRALRQASEAQAQELRRQASYAVVPRTNTEPL